MDVKIYYDHKKARKQLRRWFRTIIRLFLWITIVPGIFIPLSTSGLLTDDGIEIATTIIIIAALLVGAAVFFFELLRPDIIDPDSKYKTFIFFNCSGRLFFVHGLAGEIYRYEKSGCDFAALGMVKNGEYIEKGQVFDNYVESNIKDADFLKVSLTPSSYEKIPMQSYTGFGFIAPLADEISKKMITADYNDYDELISFWGRV